METLNCLIVDDNDFDRFVVESFAHKYPFLHVSGVFSNALEAFAGAKQSKVDVLFLDIDMPGISGIEFRRQMQEVPVCIFITSHPEHAVESFHLDALDFLVKPITDERFGRAVNRVYEYMTLKTKADLYDSVADDDSVFIKKGGEKIKLKFRDILYLEAFKDYTKVVTDQDSYFLLTTFSSLLSQSHFSAFVRVHRSFAVNKKSVFKLQSQQIVLSNGTTIPIGRKYKNELNLVF